jgi:hypothetical protein
LDTSLSVSLVLGKFISSKKVLPMFPFLKKYSLLLSVLLLLAIFGMALFYPVALPALGVICILLAFVTGAAFIIEKHKGHELMRRKVTKDILILAITLLLAVLLSGMVSRFATNVVGAYVEVRWVGWGSVAALASAILASFAVGYLVNRGVGKLSRK